MGTDLEDPVSGIFSYPTLTRLSKAQISSSKHSFSRHHR